MLISFDVFTGFILGYYHDGMDFLTALCGMWIKWYDSIYFWRVLIPNLLLVIISD